jgi:hypothetical protein
MAALLSGGAGRELTRLLPECVGAAESAVLDDPMLADPVLADPGPAWAAAADDPGRARSQLFGQMLSLLHRLAERGPVVLIIEDAQWADESSRALLSFLVSQQPALGGVLIIVTYRSDELHRGHPLSLLLARLGRFGWVQQTELHGLSRDESGELIGRITGRRPEPSLIDAVYRRTEGNPLFVEELLCCGGKRAKRNGRSPRSSPHAAGSLRDVVLAAVRRLPEPTQDALRAASVGGQQAGYPLLAAVTGMAPGALAAALRPAVEHGVLVTGQDGCSFRHALIGEVIHADLLPAEHGALHHRFAAALAADPSLVPAGRAAIEQAEHWYHAHDLAHALHSAWLAAAEAGRALACSEQLAMLTRVLELWPSVPGAERLTGTGHARVLEQAATVAEALGDRQLATALTAAAQDEINTGRDA